MVARESTNHGTFDSPCLSGKIFSRVRQDSTVSLKFGHRDYSAEVWTSRPPHFADPMGLPLDSLSGLRDSLDFPPDFAFLLLTEFVG